MPPKGTEFITVGKGVRLANLLLDYIGIILLGAAVGVVIALVGGDAGMQFVEETPDYLIGLPVVLLYYTLLEGCFGVTLGKLVTRTKAVRADGSPVGFGGAFLRALCRLIPFEGFSFLGAESRGWHDSIPNTYVIKR